MGRKIVPKKKVQLQIMRNAYFIECLIIKIVVVAVVAAVLVTVVAAVVMIIL